MKLRKYITKHCEVNMFRRLEDGTAKADTFKLISGDQLQLVTPEHDNSEYLLFTTNNGITTTDEYTLDEKEKLLIEYYDPNNPPHDVTTTGDYDEEEWGQDL